MRRRYVENNLLSSSTRDRQAAQAALIAFHIRLQKQLVRQINHLDLPHGHPRVQTLSEVLEVVAKKLWELRNNEVPSKE